ncbi:hydroxymethylglutaryl-CoA reductase, degradative [Listeria aquatica]|uniref:3-hydroxy-3-methylglutaryl coenzyme A reductase n=1 Tax=Listeria aquatica FSL S10-1188 TaxID=1265818 RepID=W7B2J8_9LIST|nr:hydroxymethylglutaryl-CoA reductase, degradative [Listeria aquatica]EUJ21439.1 3-hydroxy-3-methylglutaryl-coenzyme A reductase [Listeria aquatica FSL S10-1188]
MLEGFYKKTRTERLDAVQELCGLSDEERALFDQAGALSFETADHMVENLLGTYGVPFGLGLNMRMNGRDYLVPMATEEPSVIAAQSGAGKLIRQAGGIKAESRSREMTGQIELCGIKDVKKSRAAILAQKTELLFLANSAYPSLQKRGGGAVDLTVREVKTVRETLLVVHISVETLEAMGANMINTMVEALAPRLEELSCGIAEMRILTNLVDQATATAKCVISPDLISGKGFSGEEVRDRIVRAYEFASADIYRATTHNKGIMNGVDAVVLAFGNDTRAVEAAAHAYAAKTGTYQPMSSWSVSDAGELVGELTLPMPVAMVGGSIGIVPLVSLSKKISGVKSASELAEFIVSVGLTQNFAALRALVTEGIQRGHMSLQAKSTAIAAGAVGAEVERVAEILLKNRSVSLTSASEILQKMRDLSSN